MGQADISVDGLWPFEQWTEVFAWLGKNQTSSFGDVV